MATIQLEIGNDLEKGKCYIITGTMTNRDVGESARFEIGNDQTTDIIGTITANGAFSLSFDYEADDTFYQTLYIFESGDFDITDLALNLDESCAVQYCSECFKLNNCVADTPEVVYLEWTNNDNGFGINYESMPLIQSLYLTGGIRNMNYDYEEDNFIDSKNGFSVLYSSRTKLVELWIHDIPEYLHDALSAGIMHDEFTVNGVAYGKPEGGYSPDWETPQSLMAPVIVKLREKVQDTKNINC